jgi:hypothetical protein
MNLLKSKIGILVLASSLALSGCTSSSSSSSQQVTPPLSEVEVPSEPDTSVADAAACSKFNEVVDTFITSAQNAGGMEVEHLITASSGVFDARRNETNFLLGIQLEAWENTLTKSALELQGFGSISASTTIDMQNAVKTLFLACD